MRALLHQLLLPVVMAVLAGCTLADDPLRHRCVVDRDCVAGRFCSSGFCSSTPPPGHDATPDGPGSPLEGGLGEGADAAISGEDAAGSALVDAAADAEPPSHCGNSRREGREECDDGNQLNDDYCDDQCQWTQPPQLRAGPNHTCLRTGDRRLVCWGYNSWGDLSSLPPTVRAVAPAAIGACFISDDGMVACSAKTGSVPPPDVRASLHTDLSVKDGRACAIASTGTLMCWGASYPDGPTPPGKYLGIAVGSDHACALNDERAVVCWGRNISGESTAPAGRFTRLSVGSGRSCAIRESGQLVCWGAVAIETRGLYRAIAVGEDRICAVTREGAALCWTFTGSLMTAPSGLHSEITAGRAHACALRVDGGVTCWGANELLQSGLPVGPFEDVVSTQSDGCAVRKDHGLTCWGPGSPHLGTFPAVPPGKFKGVSFGGGFACALREDGNPVCWGADGPNETPPFGTFRQLAIPWALRADGSLVNWDRFVRPPPDFFREIATAIYHACGIRTDGRFACWTDAGKDFPTPLTGVFEHLAMEQGSLCGLRADGSVECAECQLPQSGNPPACRPVAADKVGKGPFRKIGWFRNCMCGLPLAEGPPVCWSLSGTTSCRVPAAGDGKVVDFWPGCAMGERGALLCEQPWRTVDLEQP